MKKGSREYNCLDELSKTIHVELKNEERSCWGAPVQFTEICWEIIKNNDFNNLPTSFYNLETELKGFLQYGYVKRMNPSKAFVCGALWAATRMTGIESRIEEETKQLKDLAKKYLKYKILFLEMQKKPGITFRELAKKTNVSVSEIYDLLVIELRGERLFSYSNGRQKHDKSCFLGDRGEDLLKFME